MNDKELFQVLSAAMKIMLKVSTLKYYWHKRQPREPTQQGAVFLKIISWEEHYKNFSYPEENESTKTETEQRNVVERRD